MTFAPALGISEGLQEPLTGAIVGIICFVLAYYDAKYSNTFITKETKAKTETIDYMDNTTSDTCLNEEYVSDFDIGGEDE